MTSIVSNPVLVGAVTLLVTLVAVFLAYNASNGLPFVPVYRVSIELENAQRLAVNNEVRIGGYRVGIVRDMQPVELRNGEVGARATLALDREAGSVPADTRVAVRPRSVGTCGRQQVIEPRPPLPRRGHA